MSNILIKTAAAAAHIGKSVIWLTKARMTGTGPVYLKVGAGVFYCVADLDAYLISSRRTAIYDFANNADRTTIAVA